MVTLTQGERERFAQYLEQEMHSSQLLMEQMSRLPGMESVAVRYRNQNVAYGVVVRHLRNVEVQEVNGE